jgi:hypothetical protein
MRVDTTEIIAVATGYGFALIAGNYLLVFVMDRLWQKTGASRAVFGEPSMAARLPQLVGLVERSLYVASFQIGKPEFIAVWLALKVAGQWKLWEEGRTADGVELPGRLFYNLFLIGSGLSIAYGTVGAQLIEYIRDKNWLLAVVLPSALVLGTVVLQILARPSTGRVSLPMHQQQRSSANGSSTDKDEHEATQKETLKSAPNPSPAADR